MTGARTEPGTRSASESGEEHFRQKVQGWELNKIGWKVHAPVRTRMCGARLLVGAGREAKEADGRQTRKCNACPTEQLGGFVKAEGIQSISGLISLESQTQQPGVGTRSQPEGSRRRWRRAGARPLRGCEETLPLGFSRYHPCFLLQAAVSRREAGRGKGRALGGRGQAGSGVQGSEAPWTHLGQEGGHGTSHREGPRHTQWPFPFFSGRSFLTGSQAPSPQASCVRPRARAEPEQYRQPGAPAAQGHCQVPRALLPAPSHHLRGVADSVAGRQGS